MNSQTDNSLIGIINFLKHTYVQFYYRYILVNILYIGLGQFIGN